MKITVDDMDSSEFGFSFSDDELADFASDYYKDVFGSRPRGIELTRANCERIIQQCKTYLDAMKSTEAGRARLREDGWLI